MSDPTPPPAPTPPEQLFSVTGKTVVVTGGTRGIGRMIAGGFVAAGATVPPGLVVPDRMCVMGVPGKIVRPIKEKELEYMRWLAAHYVELAGKHVRGEIAEIGVALR